MSFPSEDHRCGPVLVANRGEIALRIMAAAADRGLEAVAVYSEDDAASLHVLRAPRAVGLPGSGPAAYLDASALVAAADQSGCDALHPGYGFLSESPVLAEACARAGVVFVGPPAEVLARLGDKWSARQAAAACGIPVIDGARDVDSARGLMTDGRAVMVKAVSGGGGRGMRVARQASDLEVAWQQASAEAAAAFGSDEVYAEWMIEGARHIEVQVVADHAGSVAVLGERDCTLQRRHQKIIEVAPAPGLDSSLRQELWRSARLLAEQVGLVNLATFEFLVERNGSFWFIEANARLQVEHTVTEVVSGLDLVAMQFDIAYGSDLQELGQFGGPGAATEVEPALSAVQLRICTETRGPDGSLQPAAGVLGVLELPGGPGVRVDHTGYAGYSINPRFDPLLAKLVVSRTGADLGALLDKAGRTLGQVRVEGVPTNVSFLQAVLERAQLAGWAVDTGFVERELAGWEPPEQTSPARPPTGSDAPATRPVPSAPPGAVPVSTDTTGVVVEIGAVEGDLVGAGQAVAVVEAMKMHHLVEAPMSGRLGACLVELGQAVGPGQPLFFLMPVEGAVEEGSGSQAVDLGRIRPDLAELHERRRLLGDDARPDAVERRRRSGQRTARENIADLCDPDSFVEYGGLVIAAQRRRRSVQELIERTPGDGMVTGLATVNADLFGEEAARCVVMSYDYSVLAGTQGMQNHRKKDRMFELADRHGLPLVLFAEGGGGRPGDTDGSGVSGLDVMAFHLFGRLSGRVPLVGIVSGRCFAGNAALLGCCDVVIATAGSNIGMGGPAMIEGGGLGVFRPEDVGPMEVQVPNGVVDIAVDDEAEAVATARRYLSYFQGRRSEWDCPDQRRLRHVVPEDRLRVYDVRAALVGLADTGSVMELRAAFGPGMVTALVRVEGRPIGVVANNPTHLAGAIDADGADKAARFMQLCDAFGLPILFLCDTPGIMVGPDAERQALVRHCARLFVTGASLSVPFFTIILRKAYGLGAQTMAGGSFKVPTFCVAWPTGELGGMGLEGAVRLGYRRELDAVEDPHDRQRLFEEMVARMYEHGKALNAATHFEIDDVIDPADSRRWIVRALESCPPPPPPGSSGKRRPCIDTW